jgi:hypothetical protein
MSLYQFKEIYYRVVGEYENDIQILFFESEGRDILVFDLGSFFFVNKPVLLNLTGFNAVVGYSGKTHQILQVVEQGLNHVYLQLEDGVMEIAWYFSTASGQQEKGFKLYLNKDNRKHYERLIGEMASAKQMEITDLRFIL